jgi:hypothetical protein
MTDRATPRDIVQAYAEYEDACAVFYQLMDEAHPLLAKLDLAWQRVVETKALRNQYRDEVRRQQDKLNLKASTND